MRDSHDDEVALDALAGGQMQRMLSGFAVKTHCRMSRTGQPVPHDVRWLDITC